MYAAEKYDEILTEFKNFSDSELDDNALPIQANEYVEKDTEFNAEKYWLDILKDNDHE